MNILGIGPLELVIIVLILLLVLGPEDLEKTGKTLGRWIHKLTRSEGWKAVTTISRELRGLPARLAREAELENLREEFQFDNQIGPTPFGQEISQKTSQDKNADEEEESKTTDAEKPSPKPETTADKEKSE